MTGTFVLINHDFIIVKDLSLVPRTGFHLVDTDVAIVIWRDLVLQTMDLRNISPTFSLYYPFGQNYERKLIVNQVNHINHLLVNTHCFTIRSWP